MHVTSAWQQGVQHCICEFHSKLGIPMDSARLVQPHLWNRSSMMKPLVPPMIPGDFHPSFLQLPRAFVRRRLSDLASKGNTESDIRTCGVNHSALVTWTNKQSPLHNTFIFQKRISFEESWCYLPWCSHSMPLASKTRKRQCTQVSQTQFNE